MEPARSFPDELRRCQQIGEHGRDDGEFPLFLEKDDRRALGSLANTYRYAQNPMRAEEILRNIAENEASDTLRTAALETLRLYQLPAMAVIIPPLPANPGIEPLKTTPGSSQKP